MTQVTSWGRLSAASHQTKMIHHRDQVRTQLMQQDHQGIAYGMGRSYGDVCLNPQGVLWMTRNLDRMIAFDAETGLLRCEAGLLLHTIQTLMIPRGWMLPVTPGTQWITVGGAIANDIHGKNHHRYGTFGHHVRAITLLRTDGEIITCGSEEKADWFAATVGGLGLTGFIVEATIQLRRIIGPWLNTHITPYQDLKTFFNLADQSEADWEHTVAWIDCTARQKSRGLFMCANPIAQDHEPKPMKKHLTVPLTPPCSVINRMTLRLFNTVYYHLKARYSGPCVQYYAYFLYPLDHVSQWNRCYGPKGFYQYQSVVPSHVSYDATQEMLKVIARAHEGSFLTVLKTFSDKPSVGMLSFAQAGTTLALDFPNRGQRTQRLFSQLDAIVKEAGGRLYPAKDARMSPAMFEAGYPHFKAFLKYRDPGISSAFIRRIMGESDE